MSRQKREWIFLLSLITVVEIPLESSSVASTLQFIVIIVMVLGYVGYKFFIEEV